MIFCVKKKHDFFTKKCFSFKMFSSVLKTDFKYTLWFSFYNFLNILIWLMLSKLLVIYFECHYTFCCGTLWVSDRLIFSGFIIFFLFLELFTTLPSVFLSCFHKIPGYGSSPEYRQNSAIHWHVIYRSARKLSFFIRNQFLYCLLQTDFSSASKTHTVNLS